MIVVDTNVIVYLFLTGERSGQAEQAFRQDPDWKAPVLWRSGFRSVLAQYIRAGRLTAQEAERLIGEAERLMRGNEHLVQSNQVLDLVGRNRCSAYDCEFVTLAQELGVKLVTVDKEILADFPGVAVALEDFAGGGND